jgi:mannose-1-phosphate guanylyltransferase
VTGEKFKSTVISAVRNARKGNPTIIGVKVNDLNTFIGCGHATFDPKAIGPFYTITGFVEKPNAKRAEAMMRRGNSACNTGINVWRATDILGAFDPEEIHRRLETITAEAELKTETTGKMPSGGEALGTSELMHRFSKIQLVVGEFQWYDCGSFQALYEVNLEKATPNHHNVSIGEVVRTNCRDSLFIACKGIKLFATGYRNAVVVANIIEGKIYVAVVEMDQSQNVRELAEDYFHNTKLLNHFYSIYDAQDNALLPSNISDDVCCGFVGKAISGNRVDAIKLSDHEFIVHASVAKTA